MNGIQILSYGAFLSSPLIAAVLACVIDKHYLRAAAFSPCISRFFLYRADPSESIAWLPKNCVILGIIYCVVALILFSKY